MCTNAHFWYLHVEAMVLVKLNVPINVCNKMHCVQQLALCYSNVLPTNFNTIMCTSEYIYTIVLVLVRIVSVAVLQPDHRTVEL